MSPAPHHIQFLNPPASKNTAPFPQFAKLPAEIRLMIWTQSLCCERFIRVIANSPSFRNLFPPLNTSEDLGLGYTVVVAGRYMISKLFRVNAESRYAATRFYRVQIPCQFASEETTECQTLYINPELDTLHVVGSSPLVQFAHDIWSRDPLGIGLVNFAIDTELTKVFAERNCSGDLRPLRQVMSRLKRVIFVKSVIACGHPTPPPRPTMAAIPSFARQPDPRPIQTELKRVNVGGLNPRWGIYRWFQLIANLQLENPIDYRFMPTHYASGSWLTNRDDTTKYFQRKGVERTVCMDEECPHRTWKETEHLPQQAVGFWLFPLESLGPVPHPDDDPSEYPPMLAVRHDVDMSKYNPELCLQYLP